MIAYSIGVLPLIRELQDANFASLSHGMLMTRGQGAPSSKIIPHFLDLQVRGPPRGYFLELRNTILVVTPRNVATAKEFFRGMRLKVVTGSCYLGGFVGKREVETTWLDTKVQG